jgi:inosine/xanthosine triphosphate pyrophosphatase family protein/PKD repeat protein
LKGYIWSLSPFIVMPIIRFFSLVFTTLILSFSPTPQVPSFPQVLQDQSSLDCATDGMHEALSLRDPKYRFGQAYLEAAWSKAARRGFRQKMAPPYEIPVVFHIVHQNGAENISDGDIIRSLDFLNQSFANQGYYDQGVGVDTEIQFCLARRTPDNLPTNGINRIVSPLTNVEATAEDRNLKDLSRWNPREYVNIWVVREICGLGLGCGVAGYAYYPGAHGGNVDGIVVEARWLTTNEARATVLTHEMGHYLGLRHTFDGGCTNDDCTLDGDRVCDTPPDNSKAAVPCGGTANTCTTDTNSGFATDQNDMFNNYMDYGNWSCYNTLTAGQRDRMYFFLEGRRKSLLDSPGCLDPCPAPITASFTGGDVTIDIGTTITFTNTSTNGDNVVWRLDSTDISTANTVSQTFNSVGIYTISLTVSSNDPLCQPETVTQTVRVFCPVLASFDAPPLLQEDNLLTFTNTSTAGTNFSWTIDGNPVATTEDLQFTFLTPGLYEICLTTDNTFCGEEECRLIFVREAPCTDCPVTNDCGNAFAYSYQQPGGQQDGLFSTVLPANGIFYVGGTYGGSPMVMAIAANGVPLWQRQLFPRNNGAVVSKLLLDADGMLSGVGFTGVGLQAPRESFAFRIDPSDGNLQWARTYPNQGWEVSLYQIYQPTAGGALVALGAMEEPFSPTNFNASGTRFTIDPSTGALLNPPDRYDNEFEEGFIDAVYDASTGLYYTISIQLDLSTGVLKPQVSALDLNGDPQWSRSYETSGAFALEGFSITDDGNDLVFLVNDFGSSSQPSGFQIWKIDKTGQTQWVRKYTPGFSMPLKVRSNLVGYVVWGFVGTSERQMIIQLDREGNLLWANVYENIPTVNDFNNALATENNEIILGLGARLGSIYPTLLRINIDGTTVDDCIPTLPVTLEELEVRGSSAPEMLFRSDVDFFENQIFSEPGFLEFVPESCQDPCPPVDSCATPFFLRYLEPDGLSEGCFTTSVRSAGITYVGGQLNDQAYVGALDGEGNVLWQRHVEFSDPLTGGSTDNRHQKSGNGPGTTLVTDLLLDSEGTLVGIGSHPTGSGDLASFGFRLNPLDGSTLWARAYDQSLGLNLRNISESSLGGNYLATGGGFQSLSPANRNLGSFYFLDRTTGITLNPVLGLVPFLNEGIRDLTVDPATGILYAIGSEGDGLILYALQPDGTQRWTQRYTLVGSGLPLRGRSIEWHQGSLFLLADTDGVAGGTPIMINVSIADGRVIHARQLNQARLSSHQLFSYGDLVGSVHHQAPNQSGKVIFWDGSSALPIRELSLPLRLDTTQTELVTVTDSLIIVSGFDVSLPSPVVLATNFAGELPDLCSDVGVNDQLTASAVTLTVTAEPLPVDVPRITVDDRPVTLGPAALSPDPENCPSDCNQPEICDNQIDDDGDGFIDCLDPDLRDDCCCLLGPTVDLGPDTTICSGIFVLVPDSLRGMTIQWSTGATGDSIQIDRPGTYWLSVTDTCGYTGTDTLNILLRPTPVLELGPDTVLCQNGVFPFRAQDGFAEYEWVDGSTEKSFTAYDAGVYWVNATDSCGGRQTDTVRVTIDPDTEINLGPDTTICLGDTLTFSLSGFSNYQWSSTSFIDCVNCPEVRVWPDRDTLLLVSGEASAGCISSDSLRIRVISNFGSRSSMTLCEGDSLDFSGQIITSSGQFYATNTGGSCMVTDTLDVLLLRDTLTTEIRRICPGDSIEIFGQFERQANDYEAQFVALNGCDSIHRISLEFFPPTGSQDSLTICAGDSTLIFGQFERSAGIYQQTFVNANGCDSIHQVTLTLRDTTSSQESRTICAGDSTLVFGQFESVPGTYSRTFSATNGCDSIHRIILSLLQPQATTEMRDICAGDSTLIFGQFERSASTYTQTFTGANGCDSTHQVILTVRDTTSGQSSRTVCAGDSVLIFGRFERTAGVYTQTFPAANGCDSIHRVSLNVLNSVTTQETRSICAGDSVLIFGQFESTASTYRQTLTGANGCDSTHQIILTVRDTTSSQESRTICAGDSTLIFGQFESVPGTYSRTFPAANGCDSIHRISLSLLQPQLTAEMRSICVGDSTLIFGQYERTASTYTQSFTGASGCDSTHQVTLTVRDTTSGQSNLTICAGDSVLIFGGFERTAGVFSQTFVAANGCDSTHRVTLEVLNSVTSQETRSICAGDSVLIFGQYERTASTYTQSFTGANGCDSTHQVLLSLRDTTSSQESRTICAGDSTLIFGQFEGTPGIYSRTFPAANGCDSTHRIQLSLLQPITTSEVRTICPGDSNFIFGQFESSPGLYEGRFTGANGCDSTHQVLLELFEFSISTEVLANLCLGADAGAGRVLISNGLPPFDVSWSNGAQTAEITDLRAGTYFVSVTDGNGCTETDSLTIVEVIGQDYTLTTLPETCAGDADGRLVLEGDTTGLLVSVNNGNFLPFLPTTRYPAGDLSVRVIDSTGCQRSFDLTVAPGNSPFVDLPPSIAIDLGDSITLDVQTNLPPGWPLDWFTSAGDSCIACPDLTLRPFRSFEVSVFTEDENGCPAEDLTRILVDREKLFYVPSAFSPNGDGTNDVFRIFPGPAVEQILSFGVYDRWGGRVFWVENVGPDDALAAWDGRLNGRDPNLGVHVYVVEVRLITGEVVKRAGEVVIVR